MDIGALPYCTVHGVLLQQYNVHHLCDILCEYTYLYVLLLNMSWNQPGGNVLDLILSSQNELVDNVKVHKPLGSSDHNQIYFDIEVNTGNTYKKQWMRNFNKGKYKEMRTYLAHIDWNNLLKNKTAKECWTCLKDMIEGITERFVPIRKQGKRSWKTCQKRLLEKKFHKQMLWGV